MKQAYKQITEFCTPRGIKYELVRNDPNLRCYFIPKEHKNKAQHISKYIEGVARDNGMHCTYHSNRNGLLVAISENKISEHTLSGLINDVQNRHNEFASKISDALEQEVPVEEDQYKWGTSARRLRSAQSQQFPNSNTRPQFASSEIIETKTLNTKIDEALDGIATPTGVQPSDGIKAVKKALDAMGVWQAMKKMGVQVNVAGPGKHMITFSRNNVPLLAAETSEIAEEGKLAELIDKLSSILKGQAPEYNAMQRDAAKEQERQAKAIATKFGLNPDKQQPV